MQLATGPVPDGTIFRIFGWGYKNLADEFPEKLQLADVPYIDHATCSSESWYGGIVVCARNPEARIFWGFFQTP